jgi:hypothetical protein
MAQEQEAANRGISTLTHNRIGVGLPDKVDGDGVPRYPPQG